MINVLFIGMTSNPGGLETYMINIFSRLEGHGFHFTFLNIRNTDIAYSNFIKQHGGNIKRVVIKGNRFEHLTRGHKARAFFKEHHNYDIVHLNTTYLNLIYWIKAARLYGLKHLIIQSHNCGVTYKSKIFKLISSTLDRYNKLYLALHPNIIKLAASSDCGHWMFGKDSHFTVINNGIDTNSYIFNNKYRKLLKNKLSINNHTKVIITTARLERQKNYPKIINVFYWIHYYNKNTVLVIIGSGSKFSFIKKIVKTYKLGKYVYFLGEMPKNDVRRYLNIADLMLMPSLYEAVPFSLTEAQASGIPAIVSTNIPFTANITNEVKFLSLDKSNKIWAKYSIQMLNKKINRYQMNKMVKESSFSLSNSINKLRQLYIDLVKK